MKSKDMLLAIGGLVTRNMRSRLPSMRQMCQGLQKVLDPFAEKVIAVQREHDEGAAKWARSFLERGPREVQRSCSLEQQAIQEMYRREREDGRDGEMEHARRPGR